MVNRTADHLQQWAYFLQHGGIAANQHGEAARACSFGAAGDGGIEVVHSDLFKLGSSSLRSLGADGGAVDHDASRLELLSGTVLAKQHVVHGAVVTDAKHENVDVVGGSGWVGAAPRVIELRVAFSSSAAGVHLQVQPGFEQVDCYGESQSPEAHHADAPLAGHPFVPAETA